MLHRPAGFASIRYVSLWQWDTAAVSAAGVSLSSLAAADGSTTKAALQWQNAKTPGSVISAVNGVALNENWVNGVNTPEWAS